MSVGPSPALLLATMAALTSANSAAAQSFGGSQRITGVNACVTTAAAPGDRTRLFVLENFGRILILVNGSNLLPTPFVDLTGFSGGGNGATGLAFDPEFERNGFFYVVQVTRAVPAMAIPAGVSLVRYTVSATDPNIADPNSRTIILITPTGGQHTGGWIDFGRDGYLYLSTGDRHNSTNAQTLTDTGGKMLRIDVHTDLFPADPLRNYAIPHDNPFIGEIPGLDEVWAVGLRNPFRCSFDRATGDLWIADVGESQREEINRVTPGGLATVLNFGWPCFEGFVRRSSAGNCADPSVFTPPVFDLTRSQSTCLIGGYVYRGCGNAGMRGRYIFGNCSTSQLFSIDPASPRTSYISHAGQVGAVNGLYGFGEDADGELYACGSGGLFKLLPPAEAAFTDCNHNGRADDCEIADNPGTDINGDGVLDACTRLCPADFDASGAVNVGDVFWFLSRLFAHGPGADFNNDASIGVQDLFDFLAAYFDGCG